jgi:hypothetical protein
MKPGKYLIIIFLLLMATTLACSIFGVSKQALSVENTAQAIRTDVGGIISAGGSLINTAQALETQHPGVLETAKAIPTQMAPVLGTIQAVATSNPGLVQTAQTFVEQGIPTGEPPIDIPIYNRDQVQNYFGSSQYIFYITPTEYAQILEFYKTQMPLNDWQYVEADSNEFANAAQLYYAKDNRTTTIDLSVNPLNNTTVVVISTSIQ